MFKINIKSPFLCSKVRAKENTRIVTFAGGGACHQLFEAVWAALQETPPFEAVTVDPFLPENMKARFEFLRLLKDGALVFPEPVCLYMHYTGNRGYVSQMWRVAAL